MSTLPEDPNKPVGVDNLLPIDEHVEESHDSEGRKVRHRGIYLLPNLFTTANLFAGFYCIISAINGNFIAASTIVFVAMILDSLDGRVARLTNTQSAFGAEYDSLSDMVAFGLAPAILAYQWGLSLLDKTGLTIAFIYAACAALRLARFNTQIGKVDKRWFVGLASPAAAGVVAASVWVMEDFGIRGNTLPVFSIILFALLVAAVGLLMVSNIRYYSFKDLDLKGRVPFVTLLIVVLIISILFIDTPRVLLLALLIYTASGPVYLLLRRRQREL
ncbi:CDP-diacylglycerol--serine O-phosphatidyltransferase [Azomonas agilis]|uniref:CDP-diacylglycerol--serine O-phosphatidyltransferase n=1 Tax=Azomonas agilis TaxID=116849 RepID=A0A562I0Q9_9GAMM|nr:CDP-diacylglycerol--serine O-phosphatidyltransferase [Azomonas agilis]TWH64235.1 CDP-diacylglycerol--serine O-phosphatidyltransferase [Azomonas agilis]